MQEAGVADFEVDSWYAMFVPAKTPRAVIDRLNKALNDVRIYNVEAAAWTVPTVGGTPPLALLEPCMQVLTTAPFPHRWAARRPSRCAAIRPRS